MRTATRLGIAFAIVFMTAASPARGAGSRREVARADTRCRAGTATGHGADGACARRKTRSGAAHAGRRHDGSTNDAPSSHAATPDSAVARTAPATPPPSPAGVASNPADVPANPADVPAKAAEVGATPDSATTPAPEPRIDAEGGGSADATPSAVHQAPWAHAIAFLRASMEVGSREFSYVDRLTPTLRSYSLFAAPLARVDGELYPLARTGIPVVEGLGVTADYAMAFGLSSSNASGGSVDTSWSQFDVGLRERLPIGRMVLVGLHGGYGQIVYSFDGAQDPSGELPGVDYQFVSGGADARVMVGALSFHASGSYLGVLGTGAIGSDFPRATVGGVEARAGVTQRLGSALQLSLEVSYVRFFYTLNPEPGDANVAGGALDQMATASLGVGYLL